MTNSPEQYRILLVEDNSDDRFLVEWAIRRANLPIALNFVGDGEEGIRYLRGEGVYGDRESYPMPALIISNMKMPKINGLELVRWIKQQPELINLPVVVISSSGNPDEEDEFRVLGTSAYFVKPVSREGLVEILTQIVQLLSPLDSE